MRKKTRIYVRWSIVHIAILAIVLMFVFLGGVKFLQYEVKNELLQSHNATSELINSKIAKMLTSTDAAANTITRNKQLISLIKNTNQDHDFYMKLMDVDSEIYTVLAGTRYISDYVVYVNEGKNIIHTTSIFPAESFFTDYLPISKKTFKEWVKLVENEHDFDMYTTEKGDILCFKTIYENHMSKSRQAGTLIMKIPKISIDKNFAESIKKNTANVIMKQDKRTLYSLYDDELSSITASFNVENESLSHNGIMFFSERLGTLNVIYAVYESNAFKRLVVYERTVVVAVLLLFIFGVLLIIPLSKWQYKPIESIARRFGNAAEQSYKNEFEYINASIDFYEMQQSLNSEKLAHYKEMALSHMLSRHILEDNALDVTTILEKCDYTFSYKYHAVVIVYVKEFNDKLWSGDSRDKQLVFYAMKNVCAELFNEEFSFLTLPINDSFYVGIVSSAVEGNLAEKLSEIYNKVEIVLKDIGVEVKFHKGESFDDIRQIKTEYSKVSAKVNTSDNVRSADLVRILEKASDTSDAKNSSKRVDDIIKYIKSNYGDCTLSMESIARHVGLNSRYMLKIFKERTGVLLKDYIIKIRIDHAKELLLTDMTIEAVAGECGYASAHSFIRAFKRVTGMTPGGMRQQANIDDE